MYANLLLLGILLVWDQIKKDRKILKEIQRDLPLKDRQEEKAEFQGERKLDKFKIFRIILGISVIVLVAVYCGFFAALLLCGILFIVDKIKKDRKIMKEIQCDLQSKNHQGEKTK